MLPGHRRAQGHKLGFLSGGTAELGPVDKEIEEIMEEIEKSLATARNDEWGHWTLSPDERARLPQSVSAFFDSSTG